MRRSPVIDDLDHAAAGAGLDALGLERLLGLLLRGEHRLRLGEHLLEVGRLRHQVCSSGSGGQLLRVELLP